MNYLFDLQGRFFGTSEIAIDRSTEVAPGALTPDWNWNGVDWVFAPNVPLSSAPMQAPSAHSVLTRLEYMNRFTDAELAAIYTAAKSVIQVEIWLEKFKLAAEINLDDPATVAGLQAMEAAGLLAAGRAAEILA